MASIFVITCYIYRRVHVYVSKVVEFNQYSLATYIKNFYCFLDQGNSDTKILIYSEKKSIGVFKLSFLRPVHTAR